MVHHNSTAPLQQATASFRGIPHLLRADFIKHFSRFLYLLRSRLNVKLHQTGHEISVRYQFLEICPSLFASTLDLKQDAEYSRKLANHLWRIVKCFDLINVTFTYAVQGSLRFLKCTNIWLMFYHIRLWWRDSNLGLLIRVALRKLQLFESVAFFEASVAAPACKGLRSARFLAHHVVRKVVGQYDRHGFLNSVKFEIVRGRIIFDFLNDVGCDHVLLCGQPVVDDPFALNCLDVGLDIEKDAEGFSEGQDRGRWVFQRTEP